MNQARGLCYPREYLRSGLAPFASCLFMVLVDTAVVAVVAAAAVVVVVVVVVVVAAAAVCGRYFC